MKRRGRRGKKATVSFLCRVRRALDAPPKESSAFCPLDWSKRLAIPCSLKPQEEEAGELRPKPDFRGQSDAVLGLGERLLVAVCLAFLGNIRPAEEHSIEAKVLLLLAPVTQAAPCCMIPSDT